MEKAIRVVSIERGYDPRDFAWWPLVERAPCMPANWRSSLRIPRVIVPAYPGALSALGILISDVVKDSSRTVLRRMKKLPLRK